uniref:Polygalacturonase n=1 Tax=Kalanchoe fedtschenkoi TaxID=63787 RepID=A0A7N0VCV0_KALFE
MFFFILAGFLSSNSARDGNIVDVVKYGAKGDGQTDDAPAFQEAWKDACSGGGTFLIPEGNTFLLYPIEFEGPCKASGVHVQVLGKIVSPTKAQAWEEQCNDWISFRKIDNLIVDGSGEFDGNGKVWWSKRLNCGDRPTNVAFNECTNLKVSGINSRNSGRNHFSISHCDNAVISNITAIAPEEMFYVFQKSAVDISDVKFLDIQGTCQGEHAISFNCSSYGSGCTDIEIKNVKITGNDGVDAFCKNAHVEQSLTSPKVICS